MSMIETLRAALADRNVQAFLRVIRAGETDQTDDAYRTIVGGGKFNGYAGHPRQFIRLPKLGVTSSAAGAYQFLSRTWDECAAALQLPDFSPASQDLAAVFLIRRRGALDDVLAGRLADAIAKCAREWASLPGSPYGQPTKTWAQAQAVYAQWGGQLFGQTPASQLDSVPDLAPDAPPEPPPAQPAPAPAPTYTIPAGEAGDWQPPEPTMPMPAIVAALLPNLIHLAPELIRVFGSGGEANQRNAKAAEMVAAMAKNVTGQPTLEGAVQVLEADPQVAAQYREQVYANMAQLLGLMLQANTADAKERDAAMDRNLTLAGATGGRWLWLLGGICVVLVLFSLAVTWRILFGPADEFSEGVKMLVLGQIVIGGFALVTVFLFGTNIRNQVAHDKDPARP